jgi:cysteine-rich repeat protein
VAPFLRDRLRTTYAGPSRVVGALAAALGLGSAATTAACTDLFHSTDWAAACEDDPAGADCSPAATSGPGATSSTGTGSTGTSSGTGSGSTSVATTGPGGGEGGSGAGGATSSSSTSGGGGSVAPCGDGDLDSGEQCDDANQNPGDGCEQCAVVCAAAGEILDPVSLHCYLVTAIQQAWPDARLTCMTWGGDLVVIGSAGEQALLQPGLAGTHWIGISDSALEGTFTWVSGEPVSYTNWVAGEPDDAGGVQDCGQIRGPIADYQWSDGQCDTLLRSICERPPAGGI